MTEEDLNAEEVTPALTDSEMDELDSFLMSDATTNEVMMLDCLDGFLTAIVSGPVQPKLDEWLPRVWGPSAEDAPVFSGEAQAEKIVGLMMRHMNAIVWSLQQEPEFFEPIFDLNVYMDDEREYVDGEMWAHGYMTGINIRRDGWQALFESKHGIEMLHPIRLLGSADISGEEEALIETPAQREELSKLIPASVAWIYKFWAPQRYAAAERTAGKTDGQEIPKIGRSAPCPCGSGRKFKKCCGASTQ
jgi:uncharacterized protein